MISLDGYYAIGVYDNDKKYYQYHRASDDDKAYIDKVKKTISEEMGYRNSRDASFYESYKLQEKLSKYYKDNYGWDVVYYQIKIIGNQENISKHINKYTAIEDSRSVLELSFEDISKFILQYNNNLVDVLTKQIDNMQSKKRNDYIKKLKLSVNEYKDLTNKEISFLQKLDDEPSIIKYGDSYRNAQKILIEYLVKKDKRKTEELQTFIDDDEKLIFKDLQIPTLEIDYIE